MTDSPAFRAPLGPDEQPILEKLLVIRDRLSLLKQDRTKYVKSQDVLKFYDQIIEQVHVLNNIRVSKPGEQNRVDYVLDDCFQLTSLFFLTIGRNAEAPAAYSVVSTIKRLLEHLKEAGFFAYKDIEGLTLQLANVKEHVEQGRTVHSPHLLKLLDARIATCYTIIAELRETLSNVSPELMAVHEKLVSILRSLSALNTRSKFPVAEVKQFQEQLKEIELGLEGQPEIFKSVGQAAEAKYSEQVARIRHALEHPNTKLPIPLTGPEVVNDLLSRCFLWSEIILQRQGKIDDRFKDTFDQLLGIRNQLDKLSLTQAWSLRETDLYNFQRKLDRIDEARDADGHFLDAEGKVSDVYETRTLLYLLRKSYAIIYFMIASSEPVSEALLPIYNQLTTLRRCLVEVKRSGGVSSPRELYPYSMKLHSIDNMREDGKFVVNGDIPEGQGSVTALLAECFDMAYELRNDAEADDSDDESDVKTTTTIDAEDKEAVPESAPLTTTDANGAPLTT